MFEKRPEETIIRAITLISPEDMNTIDRLKFWDEHAQQDEADLLEALEKIKEYRMMIYNRANLIETAPYKMRLSCIRQKSCRDDRVYYYDTRKNC